MDHSAGIDNVVESGSTRILLVDDEQLITNLLSRALSSWGFLVESRDNADLALERLRNADFSMVLCDLKMPGHDGVWLLSKVQDLPEPPIMIMITGEGNIHQAIHCLTNGAYDFLLKPVDLEYLRKKVDSALEFQRLIGEGRRHRETLEEVALNERRKNQQIFMSGIDTLIRALEAKDQYTVGHSGRVAILTEGMTSYANMRTSEINDLVTAARCHDIGKIGVKDIVLLKPGRLTDEEFDQIKAHPVEGARILSPIFRDFPHIVAAARHHHESYGGAGYPDGLKGEAIPIGARIIAIADSYDAMTSNRVYRPAKTSREAVDEIIVNMGRQFCPHAVKCFLAFYSENLSDQEGDVWKDRRHEPRYPFRGNISLRRNNSVQELEISDLSISGLRIRGEKAIELSAETAVRIENHPFMPAELIWSNKFPESGQKGREFGLRIIEPSEAYLDLIEKMADEYAERRLSWRINKMTPASLKILRGKTSAYEEDAVFNIMNFSFTGAFLQSRRPLPVGTEVMVRFPLPGVPNNEIEAKAAVNHTLSLMDALRHQGAIPGMGIRFVEFSDDSRHRLEEYVSSQLAARRIRLAGRLGCR